MLLGVIPMFFFFFLGGGGGGGDFEDFWRKSQK